MNKAAHAILALACLGALAYAALDPSSRIWVTFAAAWIAYSAARFVERL